VTQIDTPDFFKEYFRYIGESESPSIYHRWTAISIIGALLGRNVWLPFGKGEIYPNQYIMLMGSAGARKGTAMSPGGKLLRAAGYETFAADSVSKEMFLADMGKKDNSDIDLDLETLVSDNPTECYVMAEEFNDFIGQGDLPFVTRLTKLWDCPAEFRHPKLHGKSVHIYKPTVSILGANTQQNFSMAIPPEAIGNGFCSRFLFIHSEPTGKLITFPEDDDKEKRDALVERLKKIRASCNGPIRIDPDAKPIFDRIYKEFKPIDDHRFTHYSTRRFTHILKLCIVIVSANLRKAITADDAINANTVLHAAERRMPKALGEFGKARNSGAAAAILDHLNRSTEPQSLNDLWKIVSTELNKYTELQDVILGLTKADKVQHLKIGRKTGYLPLHKPQVDWAEDLLNLDYLTKEEQ
jgi:hypothetical protein